MQKRRSVRGAQQLWYSHGVVAAAVCGCEISQRWNVVRRGFAYMRRLLLGSGSIIGVRTSWCMRWWMIIRHIVAVVFVRVYGKCVIVCIGDSRKEARR